jgi:hypothetical protein
MPSSDLDDIIARAAEDRPFRKRLVRDPEGTAKEAGYRLPKEDVEILKVMAEDGEDAFLGEADDGMSKPTLMIGVDEFLRTGATGIGRVETADDEEPGGEEEAEEEPEDESEGEP